MCVGHLKIFLVQRIFWHLICFYYSLVLPRLLAVTTAHLSSWWIAPISLCSGCWSEAISHPCIGPVPPRRRAEGLSFLYTCAVRSTGQTRSLKSMTQLSCSFLCPPTNKAGLTAWDWLVNTKAVFSPDSVTDACFHNSLWLSLLLPVY